MTTWDEREPGVLRLPSGLLVRGRGLRNGPPAIPPDFGVVLLGRHPPELGWEVRWIRWPDFRRPSDPEQLRSALVDVLARAEGERVEVTCAGGRGRTGTALACLAILDGIAGGEAVRYVRANYHPKAVETPGQRRFVERFAP